MGATPIRFAIAALRTLPSSGILGDSGASHDSPASIDRFNDLDSPGDGGISLKASF